MDQTSQATGPVWLAYPRCQSAVETPRKYGALVKCPRCGQKLRITSPSTAGRPPQKKASKLPGLVFAGLVVVLLSGVSAAAWLAVKSQATDEPTGGEQAAPTTAPAGGRHSDIKAAPGKSGGEPGPAATRPPQVASGPTPTADGPSGHAGQAQTAPGTADNQPAPPRPPADQPPPAASAVSKAEPDPVALTAFEPTSTVYPTAGFRDYVFGTTLAEVSKSVKLTQGSVFGRNWYADPDQTLLLFVDGRLRCVGRRYAERAEDHLTQIKELLGPADERHTYRSARALTARYYFPRTIATVHVEAVRHQLGPVSLCFIDREWAVEAASRGLRPKRKALLWMKRVADLADHGRVDLNAVPAYDGLEGNIPRRADTETNVLLLSRRGLAAATSYEQGLREMTFAVTQFNRDTKEHAEGSVVIELRIPNLPGYGNWLVETPLDGDFNSHARALAVEIFPPKAGQDWRTRESWETENGWTVGINSLFVWVAKRKPPKL